MALVLIIVQTSLEMSTSDSWLRTVCVLNKLPDSCDEYLNLNLNDDGLWSSLALNIHKHNTVTTASELGHGLSLSMKIQWANQIAMEMVIKVTLCECVCKLVGSYSSYVTAYIVQWLLWYWPAVHIQWIQHNAQQHSSIHACLWCTKLLCIT